MDIYILLSILVSALFFFLNSEFFCWGYNLALSLLILFLFLLRLAPAWRLGFLKNAAAISTASALFGVASLLVPLVRSEALLVLTVFVYRGNFPVLERIFPPRRRYDDRLVRNLNCVCSHHTAAKRTALEFGVSSIDSLGKCARGAVFLLVNCDLLPMMICSADDTTKKTLPAGRNFRTATGVSLHLLPSSEPDPPRRTALFPLRP